MARRMLAALVAVVTAFGGAPASRAADAAPSALPIIQIHGFDASDCPGSDDSYGWMPFDHVLHNAGWTGPLLPVSFYTCDYNGADITGYGPHTPAVASPDVTPDTTRAGYGQDVPIATLAHDLAWYVYRNFTVRDQPVDVVSLSMGGLIIRTALHRVQAGDPTFPPRLAVAQSITFSTPHHGLGTVAGNGADPGCHHMGQCEEWGTDSPLMTELMRDGTDPQGTGGTQWTVIGSSAGCDFLPIDSAQGLPNALQIDLTAPCYSHVGYFWDIEPEHTATAVYREGDGGTTTTVTDAPHSLTLAAILLQNPRPPHAAPPPPIARPVVTPLPKFTRAGTVLVRFTSGGEAATFDLRYREFRPGRRPGARLAYAWLAPARLRDLPAGSRALQPDAATTRFCVSARARVGTAVSSWTSATCTTLAGRR